MVLLQVLHSIFAFAVKNNFLGTLFPQFASFTCTLSLLLMTAVFLVLKTLLLTFEVLFVNFNPPFSVHCLKSRKRRTRLLSRSRRIYLFLFLFYIFIFILFFARTRMTEANGLKQEAYMRCESSTEVCLNLQGMETGEPSLLRPLDYMSFPHETKGSLF